MKVMKCRQEEGEILEATMVEGYRMSCDNDITRLSHLLFSPAALKSGILYLDEVTRQNTGAVLCVYICVCLYCCLLPPLVHESHCHFYFC